MFQNGHQTDLSPSLLDRLVDEDAGTRRDARLSPRMAINTIIRGIVADVSNLLNERTRFVSWPRHLTELDQSLLSFGLPDASGVVPLVSSELQERVESALSRFEPRLRDVSVELLEKQSPYDNTICFQIRACVGAEAEPLVARAFLSESKGQYSLKAMGD